jgi:hypothetical protein
MPRLPQSNLDEVLPVRLVGDRAIGDEESIPGPVTRLVMAAVQLLKERQRSKSFGPNPTPKLVSARPLRPSRASESAGTSTPTTDLEPVPRSMTTSDR